MILALSACARSSDQGNASPQMSGSDMEWGYEEDAYVVEAPAMEPAPGEETGQERMVIQTASLQVSVADTVAAMRQTLD